MRHPRPTAPARPRGAILALAPLVLALAGCSKSPGTVPTRATARGVVHDFAGRPLAGARVKAGALPEVTSAADGSYRAGEVDVPYDLVIVVPGLVNGAPLVHLYQGLTRGDLLPRTFAFLGDARAATLSGTVAFRPGGAGAFPMAASGGNLKLSLGTPELRMYVFPDLATGSWTHSALWTGPPSVNATLHALAWEEAAGVPVRYLGYGERPSLGFTDGDTLTGVAVTLDQVGQTTFSGTVQVPAGYTHLARNVYLLWGLRSEIGLVFDGGSPFPTDFAYIVPSGTGGSLYLWGVAEKPGACSVSGARTPILLPAGGVSGVVLSLQACAEPLSPAAGAAGIGPGSTLSWSPYAGGVHMAQVFPDVPSATAPAYYLITTATQVRLPDLSSMGIAPPPATAYSWLLQATSPCLTADVAATDDGCQLFQPELVRPFQQSTAAIRGFTTPP